jgi:hypothetical protein
VQRQMGTGWDQQSVASAIFSEGLAMRVTQRLEPGLPTNDYSASSPEWLKSCQTRVPQVLAELEPHLADQGADAVAKFIYQTGTAGIDREIYCAGWVVVGDLQRRGLSLRRLGGMSRTEAERIVAREVSHRLHASARLASYPDTNHTARTPNISKPSATRAETELKDRRAILSRLPTRAPAEPAPAYA